MYNAKWMDSTFKISDANNLLNEFVTHQQADIPNETNITLNSNKMIRSFRGNNHNSPAGQLVKGVIIFFVYILRVAWSWSQFPNLILPSLCSLRKFHLQNK